MAPRSSRDPLQTPDEDEVDDLLDVTDELDLADPRADEERFASEDEVADDELLGALDDLEDEGDGPAVPQDRDILDDGGALDDEVDGLLDEDLATGEVEPYDEGAQDPGIADGSPDLPQVPWSTTATLPDLGITLPAVLDPTRAISTWVVVQPGTRRHLTTRVQLPGVELMVELHLATGDDPGLRLGRDALRGRLLIAP